MALRNKKTNKPQYVNVLLSKCKKPQGSKLDEIRNDAAQISLTPDIAILTETWILGNTLDSEYGLTGYNLCWYDRSSRTSVRRRGDGLLIAVRKHIRSSRFDFYSFLDLSEQLFVSLQFNPETVIIGSTYISQDLQNTINTGPYLQYSSIVGEMFNKFSNCKIALCGDFNLRYISWNTSYPVQFYRIKPIPPSTSTASCTIVEAASL